MMIMNNKLSYTFLMFFIVSNIYVFAQNRTYRFDDTLSYQNKEDKVNSLIYSGLSLPNKKLNENIHKFINLERITFNNIYKIPSQFFELHSLKEIIIPYSKIKVIPIEICKLLNLEYIFISNTPIAKLPKCFFYLTKL